MWANEKDSPYTEKKRFDWYRGYHMGGRSLLWGRQSYRLNEADFEANLKEGVAVDWPIRYADLAPWYDYVERFAGISGNRDGLDVLPDGQYLPAFELNIVEKDVAARIKKSLWWQPSPDLWPHRQYYPAKAGAKPRQLPVPR